MGKIIAISVAAFIGLVILFSFLSFAIGWITLPGEIYSRSHVQQEWEFAYDYNNKLKTEARIVCASRVNYNKAVTSGASDDELSLDREQVFTYSANYASIESTYDQELQNAFKAGRVAPSNVPSTAPTLDQEVSNLEQTEGLVCPPMK